MRVHDRAEGARRRGQAARAPPGRARVVTHQRRHPDRQGRGDQLVQMWKGVSVVEIRNALARCRGGPLCGWCRVLDLLLIWLAVGGNWEHKLLLFLGAGSARVAGRYYTRQAFSEFFGRGAQAGIRPRRLYESHVLFFRSHETDYTAVGVLVDKTPRAKKPNTHTVRYVQQYAATREDVANPDLIAFHIRSNYQHISYCTTVITSTGLG